MSASFLLGLRGKPLRPRATFARDSALFALTRILGLRGKPLHPRATFARDGALRTHPHPRAPQRFALALTGAAPRSPFSSLWHRHIVRAHARSKPAHGISHNETGCDAYSHASAQISGEY